MEKINGPPKLGPAFAEVGGRALRDDDFDVMPRYLFVETFLWSPLE